jgi:hypothetical protein
MWSETKKQRLQQQLKIYEERLQWLTEDYGALSQQISYETNAKAKNDLRRQLALIEKDIEQAEQEQSQIYAKLQSLEFERPSPQVDPKPALPNRSASHSYKPPPYSVRLPQKISRYVLSFGASVILVLLWTYLKSQGNSVVNEPSILSGEIIQKLCLYGGIGGLITVLLWYLAAFLQQQATQLNIRKLLVHCVVGAIAGCIAWYLPEQVIHNTYNEARYGEGATFSASFCLLASLLILWIPLVFSSASD